MGKLLENYRDLTSPETLRQIRKLAKHFEGRSLLHIYSGRLLTGVKEMLDRLRGIFIDSGIHHQTAMLTGTEEFFDLVRAAEAAFPRKPKPEVLGPLKDLYAQVMKENAGRIYLSADVVVVHGMQPVGLIDHRPDRHPWVWRCHADLSESLPGLSAFAGAYLGKYQAALFPHGSFAPELSLPTFIVPPSIDPFGQSNREMSRAEMEEALKQLHVPADRALVLQFLSRGTTEEILEATQVWKGVRGSREATLVLLDVGLGQAKNGNLSEGSGGAIGRGEDVYLVCVESGNSRLLAALGWAAEAAIDASMSPWPNLYVLDLLWKSKPVLLAEGSRTAKLVRDCDVETYRSPEDLAWRLGGLLADKDRARHLGQSGRTCVLQRYLPTRHLLDYLKLMMFLEETA